MGEIFEYIKYILVLVVACFVWFIIARVWVGFVDLVIGGLKKLFGIKEKEREGNWHVLDDEKSVKKESVK